MKVITLTLRLNMEITSLTYLLYNIISFTTATPSNLIIMY